MASLLAAEVDPETSVLDVAFGYLKPEYSDCTLRVQTSGSADDEAPCDELPCSSIVLAAKSAYFRTLFQSSFKEASGKRIVDIHLEIAEKDSFSELLYFVYRGAVPDITKLTFASTRQLLVLADRFQVESCISFCLETLILSSEEVLTCDNALCCLGLPDAILKRSDAAELLHWAEESVLDQYTPLLPQAKDQDQFLSLPAVGLFLILESVEARADHLPHMLDACCHWIDRNINNGEEQLSFLFNSVLTRLPLLALPPSAAKALTAWLQVVLQGIGREGCMLSVSEAFGESTLGQAGDEEASSPAAWAVLGALLHQLVKDSLVPGHVVQRAFALSTAPPKARFQLQQKGPAADVELHLPLLTSASVQFGSMSNSSGLCPYTENATRFSIDDRSFSFKVSLHNGVLIFHLAFEGDTARAKCAHDGNKRRREARADALKLNYAIQIGNSGAFSSGFRTVFTSGSWKTFGWDSKCCEVARIPVADLISQGNLFGARQAKLLVWKREAFGLARAVGGKS